MRYIINQSTNPHFNLALDEYVMKSIDVGEDYFILWQNRPSVIIGKNQNTLEEIDLDYAEKNNITIARRVTGGGAVYHDKGNLNFTIVTNVADISKVNFKKYVLPVIDALAAMGISAEPSGRNDILVDGKKISGNAQRQANGRLMHHGTLMFDVNIEQMVSVLNPDPEKFVSKAEKSVRSRVTNIKDHMPDGVGLDEFWQQLHLELSNQGKDAEIILTEEQIMEVHQAANDRFATWDWVYGKSPKYTFTTKHRFTGGTIEPFFNVMDGYIKSIRLRGDYLGLNDISEIELALIDVKYKKAEVRKVLENFEIQNYFTGITLDEVMSVLF